MIKSRSGNVEGNRRTYCLPILSSHDSHHQLSHRTQVLSRYEQPSNCTILPATPSLNPQILSHRDRILRWKKQSREKKLQAVYDENIRLFVSLSKQRSVYTFHQRKKQERRPLPQRLLPLGERMQVSRAV